jgi:hypothetical protein
MENAIQKSTNARLAILSACLISISAAFSPLAFSADIRHAQDAPERPVVAPLNLGGKLVYNLDNKAVIHTKLGNVLLAPKVTVYVFENNRGVTIYNFDSNKKDDVKMVIGKKQFFVRTTEQLVVSHRAKATFKDINPGLGISYKRPTQVTVGPGLTGYAAEFSLASGVEKIPLLTKMAASSKASERDTINRILKNAAILQPNSGFTAKALTATSGIAASVPTSNTESAKTIKGSVEVFARGGKGQVIDLSLAKVGADGLLSFPGLCWLEYVDNSWEDKQKLAKNPTSDPPQEIAGLISCPVNTTVKTELGYVDCKQGSHMFVVNRKDTVAICTLESPNVGDVVVHVGGNFSTRVPPGREILLTKDLSGAFDKLSPAHQISHRDGMELGTIDGTRVAVAEFSLPSAILAISPLGEKLNSNKPEDRRIVDAMLKDAVILTKLTGDDGPYSSKN